nr:MAG TPA: hypothetical protein [Caudoviricetes sp.]
MSCPEIGFVKPITYAGLLLVFILVDSGCGEDETNTGGMLIQ